MEQISQEILFKEDEIDISSYWRVLSCYKWGILMLSVLVTLIGGLIVFSLVPQYKATTTLLIEPQSSKMSSIKNMYGLDDPFGMLSQNLQYYTTQLELLKSRKLVEAVIRQFSLTSYPEFQVNNSQTESFSIIRDLKKMLRLSEDDLDAHTLDFAVAAFKDRLTVELIRNTQLIQVSFESESPELAAKIANALSNAYIDDQLSTRNNLTARATGWMEKRVAVIKHNLLESEKNLQSYKEKNHLVDVKGVGTLTEKELDKLTSQIVRARAKYSELSKRYGKKNPKLLAALSELHSAEQELARGKSKIQDIGRKRVQLDQMKRDVDSNQKIYDTFMSRLKEANQAIDLQTPGAHISDLAVAPLKPFKPKKTIIISIIFFVSLILGVLLAFLHESLDKTIKSPKDIEDRLGQPILGLLPIIRANQKDRDAHVFAMLNDEETAYAEAMRTIRTGLVLSSLDNPHKVILVTSSMSGEGKTTICSNLATTLAQMEKVLLIGADLRRPSLSKALGVNDSQGLTNFVAGTSKLSDCIHRIEKAGFDALPCGQLPPNPLDLLSSQRFADILKVLENKYDRIVIDSPPIHAVSDSLVLSKYAKAVVYVVEADSTHEDAVKNGIKRLLQYGAPIAGIILNKFDTEKSAKYSYGYDGYYDHYGYSDSSET